MALPISIPYTFSNATTSIPLSQLDTDISTIYATVNGIGNGTVALANVVITGGIVSNLSTAISVSSGGTGATSLTANNVLLGNGTNTVQIVAPGTSGNVLTSNGTTWLSSAASGGNVPSPSAIGQVPFSTDGSTWTATQKVTQGTSVSPTTSTSIDFTSIPSWVKKITVTFAALKSSGGSAPTVRLGTSGGIVSSGYVGTIEGAAATGPAFATISLGFDLLDVGSAAVANLSWSGLLNLAKVDTGNTWVANYVAGNTGAVGSSAMFWMGGSVNLGATLTTLRITSANGTVQFTGGTVNILYE